MFRKDTFLNGFIFGLICPVMFYVIFNELNEMVMKGLLNKPRGISVRFLVIMSVCTNILPFMIYTKTHKDNAMRGVMLITFVYVVILFILILWTNILPG